jgi:hypothetical protein
VLGVPGVYTARLGDISRPLRDGTYAWVTLGGTQSGHTCPPGINQSCPSSARIGILIAGAHRSHPYRLPTSEPSATIQAA